MGRARRLDVTRLKGERDMMIDFLETVLSAGTDEFQSLLGASAELGRAKQDFEDRMSILTVLIGDLVYIQTGMPDRIVNVDIEARLRKLAERTLSERLIAMSEFVGVIESSLKSNLNRQMLADVLALAANQTAAGFL
jgi:hypothetical protein